MYLKYKLYNIVEESTSYRKRLKARVKLRLWDGKRRQ